MIMDNGYSRSERAGHTVKKKRLRKRGLIPLLIILLLAGGACYIYFSYQSGLDIAKESGVEQKTYEFNGVDDNDGKKNILLQIGRASCRERVAMSGNRGKGKKERM